MKEKHVVRFLLLCLLILVNACGSREPEPVRPPAIPPAVHPDDRRQSLDLQVFLNGREIPLQGISLDTDEAVAITLHFPVAMERSSTENALRQTLPSESTLNWVDAQKVQIEVPAGGPFVVNPDGARPQEEQNQVRLAPRSVHRPANQQINLYRALDLAQGRVKPVAEWQVRTWTNGLVFAPEGDTALAYQADPLGDYGPAPHLLHLPTRKWTPLQLPNQERTLSFAGWLPDRRLLLAGAGVWIGDSKGKNMEQISQTQARYAAVSPSGRYVALWSNQQVSVLDTKTKQEKKVEASFRPAGPGGVVRLVWTPDEAYVAGGDHDSANPLSVKTLLVSPLTGKTVRIIEGITPVRWLSEGVLGWRPPSKSGEEGSLVLLGTSGEELRRFPDSTLPSPDGTFLIGSKQENDATVFFLVETRSGRETRVSLPAPPYGWSQQNELVVISTSAKQGPGAASGRPSSVAPLTLLRLWLSRQPHQ